MIYRCDLHIHTALSPCAASDMTPADIVAMARLKGLDIIAITDHQSCGNCASAIYRAAGSDLTVIPGLEISSAEEIHLLCLFAELETAAKFGDLIEKNLILRDNRPEIFGRQIYFNQENEERGQEKNLLIMPCALTTQEVVLKALELGGACVPAHIDRSSFSMLSTFGTIPDDLPLHFLELSAAADRDQFSRLHPELACYEYIQSSDAHSLGDIAEPGWPLELKPGQSGRELAHNLISALRPISEQ